MGFNFLVVGEEVLYTVSVTVCERGVCVLYTRGVCVCALARLCASTRFSAPSAGRRYLLSTCMSC